MLKTMKCKKCDKEFTFKYFKSSAKRSYCSYICSTFRIYDPNITYTNSFYKNATKEQLFNKLKEIFERKIIKKEGCWDFLGCKDKDGYGFITVKKPIRAHRASYMIYKGEIPKGLLVCHKCDNPSCTNPDHLFLGTNKENSLDKIKKGRMWHPSGEKSVQAKLNIEQLNEIKKLLLSKLTLKNIADKFNVSISTICAIKKGRTWKNHIA